MQDMGTVVTGKIESGRVRKGQTILIMPNKVIILFSRFGQLLVLSWKTNNNFKETG